METIIVSVVVVSYNSQNTIHETLESILNQSYDLSKIEIVFADDFSGDSTRDIIYKWVNKHRDIFHSIVLSFLGENRGVAINCNTAWRLCKGSWIKSIAADDVLHVDCIKNNINYAMNNDSLVIFSKMQIMKNGILTNNLLPNRYDIEVLQSNIEDQLCSLYESNISGAPTTFINRQALMCVDFADERYPMLEDYPLWVKFLQNGVRLDFVDIVTVYYRVDDSISRSKRNIVNLKYFNDLMRFEKEVIFSNLRMRNFVRIRKQLWYGLMCLLIKVTRNKRNKLVDLICPLLLLIKPAIIKTIIKKVEL